ncbi:MAG: DUF4258 domain-containing protein [Methylococcales bacterium]|jgi:hypothetical protein|nr:DUF4258 domain-containing protein [Methylococcales bacterium]MBT7410215.1 DUF4258 domain-containing protein [Methylococcales bacterium]
MKKCNKTKHAKIQMDKRAITETCINLLLFFGDEIFQKSGTSTIRLSHKIKKELIHAINKERDIIAVMSNNNTLITAMHHYKK